MQSSDKISVSEDAAEEQKIVLGKRESKYRLIQDNFLTPSECEILGEFARQKCVLGDGYGGNPHPHTPNESFYGYSINGRGDVSHPSHILTLQVMMRTRKLLMWHFRLPFLWVDFGHLVMRKVDSAVIEEEFSHPWHFDDQSAGVRYRTHTAIMYINDNFTGGETCFKETDFGPFREVRPSPGRLVAFSAKENAHAVRKLKSGERYVLNVWFSTNWRKYRNHRKIFRTP